MKLAKQVLNNEIIYPLVWAVKCFAEVDSPAQPSQTDCQTHHQTNLRTHHQTDHWSNRQTNRQTYCQNHGWHPLIHDPSWLQSTRQYTFIDTQSKLIAINLMMMTMDIQSKLIINFCHHTHLCVHRPPCHLGQLEGCALTLWLHFGQSRQLQYYFFWYTQSRIQVRISNVELRFWQCQI